MNGQDLAARRKALRMNQSQLADLWGVTRQTIGDWENDRARVPTMADMALRHMEAHPEAFAGQASVSTKSQLVKDEMIEFIVKLQDEVGNWQGLGRKAFRISPRVDELISFNVGESSGYLQVITIIHPLDGAETAGDLIVKQVANDFVSGRNFIKSLY